MRILGIRDFISEKMKIVPLTDDEFNKIKPYYDYNPEKVDELWENAVGDICNYINNINYKVKYPKDKLNRIKNSMSISSDIYLDFDEMFVMINTKELLKNSDGSELDEQQTEELSEMGLPSYDFDDMCVFAKMLFSNLKNVMAKTETNNYIDNRIAEDNKKEIVYFNYNDIGASCFRNYVDGTFEICFYCSWDMDVAKYGDRNDDGTWEIEPTDPEEYKETMKDLYLTAAQDIIDVLNDRIISVLR